MESENETSNIYITAASLVYLNIPTDRNKKNYPFVNHQYLGKEKREIMREKGRKNNRKSSHEEDREEKEYEEMMHTPLC